MPTQSLDLRQSIFDKIEGIGIPAAAKLFHVTETAIKKWQGGTAEPGVTACQIVLDEALSTGTLEVEVDAFEQPPVQGQTKPEARPTDTADEDVRSTETDGEQDEKLKLVEPKKAMTGARKASFCIPINRDISYATVLTLLGNWKSTLPEEIRAMLAVMDFEPDTTVHAARNILATRFLASGNEWSHWWDSDMIGPIGNPGWFKKRTASKHEDKWFAKSAFEALTGRGKSIIGAPYIQRTANTWKLVAQPGLNPTGELDKRICDEVKAGPVDKVVQIGWIGFGCVAVHRKVFEDILRTQPDVAGDEGKPHKFFNPIESGPQSEDIAFCQRAAAAGHPTFMDMALHCAHIGKYAYMP